MRSKQIIAAFALIGGVTIIGISVSLGINIVKFNQDEETYKKANELLYKYELDESEKLFQTIYNYRDSAAKIGVIHGVEALNETGNYNKAIDATVEKGGVIEVAFTSEGTPVDPITITSKTKIEAVSYLEHYDFLKWNILSYYLIEDSHSFQLNLFSSFTPHLYSIDYDVGEGFVIDPVRSYTYGTSVVATNAYRDGYTFTGYTVGDDETLYNPFVIKETDGENFRLTAHYAPNEYTYHFDPQGGTCLTEEATYRYDQTYLIPSATKEGYVFTGWFTDYGKKLDSKINIDENTTLYARYEPRQFNINYDLRGGQFLEAFPTGYNIESEDVAIPYPNREGYIFLGWVVDNQTHKYSEINYVIPTGTTGNLTLHACWRQYTSDYGNSYIKSLDDFDLPEAYPYDASEYIPGYVIPYNISSFSASVFDNELIHSFGVDKKNSTFSVIGNKNQFLVNKEETEIYKMAFTDNTLVDVNLPSSITTIKDCAFMHSPVKSISSESVTLVEKGAFSNSLIESVNLPSVETYEDEAFLECHNLANINDSLLKAKSIGDKCFLNTHLSTVVVSDEVSYLGPSSFGGSEDYHFLTSFECLSKEFKTMEDVFKGQSGTVSLKLAKVVNSMKQMFGGTKAKLDVVTLVGVSDIPDEFLYEVDSINELTNTVDVITVGDRAFYGMDVGVIPPLSKVTDIGESAFEKCENIGEVTLEDAVSIGECAFKDSGLTKINIPASVEYIGDRAFEGCESLEKLIFASPLQLSKIGSVNRLFGEYTFAPNLDIEVRGEGTLPIGAFKDLYVGKSVTLGEKVSLSEFAFYNATSVQNIYFSHECNDIIPKGCFENASCLKTIDITNVVEIDSFAFNNCTSLVTITDQNEADDNVLGNSLHTIHNQAFGNLMKIDHIEITNSAITYGSAIFANDTFEIWTHGFNLSDDALKDFQGIVYDL